MRRFHGLLTAVLLSIAVLAAWSPAQAQFGKLKDKVKQKAEQKVDKKVDEAVDGSGKAETEGEAESEESTDSSGEAEQPAAAGGTATSEDMQLYTKYDFVPGDKVILYDDLSRDEIGEFPGRWKLENGVFEVVKKGDRNWIMCTDQGVILPKIPSGLLPPKYTIEVDFWVKGGAAKGHYCHIRWYDAENREIGNFGVQNNDHTNLRIGIKDLASKTLTPKLGAGIHTMRVMATKTSMKCYIDSERVANVPAVEEFQPHAFGVFMDPWLDEEGNPMLIGNLRYAEGGKTLKEQLDETGKIVTHGILFDSGSTKIKAESHKTLADIGGLLTDSPALRLSIEGHTDSDGADDANLALSKGRADAVKSFLVESYKIDAGRLETKGLGEGTPIDTNDSPEGKANNRRVELVKL